MFQITPCVNMFCHGQFSSSVKAQNSGGSAMSMQYRGRLFSVPRASDWFRRLVSCSPRGHVRTLLLGSGAAAPVEVHHRLESQLGEQTPQMWERKCCA